MARDASAASRATLSGKVRRLQVDNGGERDTELRTDVCPEMEMRLQFQGEGAHPWLLGRCNGLARGIYSRPDEDCRVADSAILGEVQ